MDEEKRHFTRIDYDARVIIKRDNLSIDGELIDISLNGALSKSPNHCQLNVGDECEVTIDMGCEHDPIQYDATVKHIHDNLVGVCCNQITPESATTLRRIIELNLGDNNLMNRELEAMITLRQN